MHASIRSILNSIGSSEMIGISICLCKWMKHLSCKRFSIHKDKSIIDLLVWLCVRACARVCARVSVMEGKNPLNAIGNVTREKHPQKITTKLEKNQLDWKDWGQMRERNQHHVNICLIRLWFASPYLLPTPTQFLFCVSYCVIFIHITPYLGWIFVYVYLTWDITTYRPLTCTLG